VDHRGDPNSIGFDTVLDPVATDEDLSVFQIRKLRDLPTAFRKSLESFRRSEDSLDESFCSARGVSSDKVEDFSQIVASVFRPIYDRHEAAWASTSAAERVRPAAMSA